MFTPRQQHRQQQQQQQHQRHSLQQQESMSDADVTENRDSDWIEFQDHLERRNST